MLINQQMKLEGVSSRTSINNKSNQARKVRSLDPTRIGTGSEPVLKSKFDKNLYNKNLRVNNS